MGLQLIRGILPESIDVYLNNAIVELTRQELINGVQVNMQTEQTSNVSVMSKINTFKTLYRTVRYSVNTSEEVDDAYSDKVEYVNKDLQLYQKEIEAREDAGTPGILQLIRASLAYQLRNEIGFELPLEYKNYSAMKIIRNIGKQDFTDLMKKYYDVMVINYVEGTREAIVFNLNVIDIV